MNDISNTLRVQASTQAKPKASPPSGAQGKERSPILNPSPTKDVVTLERSEPVVKAIDVLVDEVMDALVNRNVDLGALTHNLNNQSRQLVK
ncbi:hypothetical protein [Magnetococcus sp. PR-3]|uniref:hypothetical protein n=1 Tax=Magnetococcus sp. PR-3 TaxID=3120355 RepID=UPI002FCDECC0